MASAAAGILSAANRPGNWIDAHVHVWTGDLKRYPLASGYTREQMKPPQFLPEEIIRHGKGSGVNRIVLIQMSYYQFDNSYMLDVIKAHPKVFGGVGIVDSNGPDPAAKMRELKKGGVRGFRIYPGKGSTAQNWLDSPGFHKMFQCGAEERLAMCPLINPDALAAVGRHCERYPNTPVVIDHMARIGATGAIREEDIKELVALARHKNVKVKVSAFYALGAKKAPYDDLAPLIRRLYDTFGPQRLMWASDCPFQTVNGTYEASVSLVADRLPFLSSTDKDWILRKTAEETYYR